ncbi:MAG: alpha/beta fold hydrolase [Thermodesulfobacteriota bacterium]
MSKVDLDREHRGAAPRVHARGAREAALKVNAAFRGAWWLPGPHLQTVWGQFTRPRTLVSFERELLTAPDGDELVLDHVAGPPGSPRLLLLHGLEGSSYSVYAQGMMLLASAAGMRGTVLNFRSCARDPNDVTRWLPNERPRLYHSGETTDFDHVVRELARREPGTPLVAAGVSLGGNVLLKWLGEHPEQELVGAAATVSVPYDLSAGARHLACGIGRLYTRHFLPTLCDKIAGLARRFPEVAARVDLERARRARDFHPFDDAATAPLHGFAGAEDYYARSSSLRVLHRIGTPTLCISAEDDPFLPRHVLEQARDAASPSVELVVTPRGGHCGFVAGRHPRRPGYWAEELVVRWLATHCAVPDAD